MDQKLVARLKFVFEERYGQQPILVASPGRINIIGEHTDYNDGFVFPATIDKYIFCALAGNSQSRCRIFALDLNEAFEIDLSTIQKAAAGSWKNYIIGVLDGLLKSRGKLPNFDLIFCGNIPIGAGLSSSAALENSVVFGLNELFKLNLTKREMIHISVRAEHEFAGVECGIMDQFSNLHGVKDGALLLDCSDLSYQLIPLVLAEYQLVLINTNVKHQLSDSPYNQRKAACKSGFELLRQKYPKLQSLSHADLDQLYSLKKDIPPVVYQRCQYVIEENNRVELAKVAIVNKDWKALGALLFASHYGLKDLYEVSCEELDFIVEKAANHEAVLGSRMMGGGFGGCTLNLVKTAAVNDFVEVVSSAYQVQFGINVSTYPVRLSDGIHLIEVKH